MRRRISSAAIVLSVLMIGCSKEDESGSTASTPPPPPPEISRADRLNNGPRTALELKPFAPMTMKVPAGWELKHKSEADTVIVTIEGSTPTDFVGILVPTYESITVDQEKSLEAGAKKDFVDHPDLLAKVGIKDLTGAKLIERITVDPILPTTQPAATTEPIQTMQWNLTLCVPSTDGKDFTAYGLRFLGLTLKSYKTDQAFLRSITDSITYTPSTDIPDALPK